MTLPTRGISAIIIMSVILVVGGVVYGAHATLKLRVSATPHVGQDNGVVVEVIVPRDPRNRRLRMTVDGPLYRVSEEPLDGADAAVVHTLTIRGPLAEGDYVVTADVVRDDTSVAFVTTRFCRGSCLHDDPLNLEGF